MEAEVTPLMEAGESRRTWQLVSSAKDVIDFSIHVCLMCACIASLLVSCNESESEGSVPELEESDTLRPSEPQVSASLLKTVFVLC